jgi:hypothetical protein
MATKVRRIVDETAGAVGVIEGWGGTYMLTAAGSCEGCDSNNRRSRPRTFSVSEPERGCAGRNAFSELTPI